MTLLDGWKGPGALHLAWHGRDLRLWFSLWGHSLWIDTHLSRFEIDGRAMALWSPAGRRPFRCLDGIPLEALAVDPEVEPLFRRLAQHLKRGRRLGPFTGFQEALPRRFGWVLALLLAFGGAWAALGQGAWPGRAALAAALGAGALLGSRLRGISALVWIVAGILTALTLHPRPPLPSGLLAGGVLLVWMRGWIRLLGPWPWILALLQGSAPVNLLPLALGTAASLLGLRRERLALGSDREAIWRFEVLGQALAEVDNGRLWALHPVLREQIPPMSAAFARLDLCLDQDQRPWEVVTAEGRWIFLPEAILDVREGLPPRVMGFARVRIAGRPCTWEGAPPGMGKDQFILRFQGEGAEPLELLFGRRWQGERLLKKLSVYFQSLDETSPAPSPRPEPGSVEEALAILGLSPGSGPREIRRAYHRLARRFHPDAYPGLSPAEREDLEARMRELNRAHERLKEAQAGEKTGSSFAPS